MSTEQSPGAAEQEAKSAEEKAGQYIRRVRSLPVDQVLGDVLLNLLQAAQIKVGRYDARLLIDVTSVAHEHARGYLPGDLTKQIDEALGQLRMAQVSAEGKSGAHGQPEENDLDRAPAPPRPGKAQ